MNRPDLIALTGDDLAALANRGLVKRAQRDVESGEFTAEWEESDDGAIRAIWSDHVTCLLPGGKTVKDARCSCPALELCRHILRTILAWQLRRAAASPSDAGQASDAWDPGHITDAMLENQVAASVRSRADILWSQGVLAELLRSAKPSARFYCPGHTVRFPVPDDLRYAQCSCADPAPCVHAILAVRAFRLLSPEVSSGIVSEGPLDMAVPDGPIAAAEGCVRDLLIDGFASLGSAWRDRVRRVAADCSAASLMWPSQILEELADDWDRYSARDAAFAPQQAAERAGELLLRIDAIAAGCAPSPQAFIRGMKSDRDSELGAARFIGLGGSVVEARRGSTVNVYLQDCDNGHVVKLIREFAEDPDSVAPRRPFRQLACATAVKDASLALLAAGQLFLQGGRRTASGRLVIGRSRAVVNPQNYAWEQLKAPVLVEDFAELAARLRLLPPASFRPRRAAADFHVCPLDGVEHAAFDPATNSITGILRDRSGNKSQFSHPWTQRCEAGAEALLSALVSGAKPLFVAGHVRASGDSRLSLLFHPTTIVFAGEGASRRGVMPWLDGASKAAVGEGFRQHHSPSVRQGGSRYGPPAELMAEVVLNGLRRISNRQWPGWARAIVETEECGCHRMAAIMRRAQEAGDDAGPSVQMLKLLTLARDATA
jgi:hypothetical protein